MLGCDLLARVEDVGDVHRRRGEGAGQRELHGQAALHVRGPEAPQHVALHPCGGVPVGRHRVGVPGEDHTGAPPELGAGDQVVADPLDLEVRQCAQLGLEVVGDGLLRVALRRDVHQLGREREEVRCGHRHTLRGTVWRDRYGSRP